MKVKVHRCKFIDFKLNSINSIKFNNSKVNPRLCLLRSNGDIELYDVSSRCHLALSFNGGKNASIEDIVYTKDGRLFSCDLYGWITEWDTESFMPKFKVESYGGAVWCMELSPDGNYLACGCEDGTVRIFDISSGINYVNGTDAQPGRVLSLAYSESGSALVTGSSQGQIRILDVESGLVMNYMNTDYDGKNGVIIWSVQIVNNNTIVSAESTGKTNFWDMKTGTLLVSHLCHEADVLALAVDQDKGVVFSSGIDNTLIQFHAIKGNDGSVQWMPKEHKKIHMNDVRALCNGKMPNGKSFLASGGVDSQLKIIHDFQDFSHNQNIVPYPCATMFSLSESERLLMIQYSDNVSIWKFMEGETRMLLAKLSISSDREIHASALSECGKWVAISTLEEVKLFQMDEMKITKIDVQMKEVQRFCFAENQLVGVSGHGLLQWVDLEGDSSSASSLLLNGFVGPAKLMKSKEEQIVVIDASSRVFIVKDKKLASSSIQFDRKVTALTIHPKAPTAYVGLSNGLVIVINLKKNEIDPLSFTLSKSKSLIKEISNSPIRGLMFHPEKLDSLIIQSLNSFITVDLNEFKKRYADTPATKREREEETVDSESKDPSATKRKNKKESSSILKINRQFQPLIYMGVMDKEFVVIDKSWISMLESLPPSFDKKRFGT